MLQQKMLQWKRRNLYVCKYKDMHTLMDVC